MKYCKDCVHLGNDLCRRFTDVKKTNDLVNGPMILPRYEWAQQERAPLTIFERILGTKRCGPDARFFEAKGGE